MPNDFGTLCDYLFTNVFFVSSEFLIISYGIHWEYSGMLYRMVYVHNVQHIFIQHKKHIERTQRDPNCYIVCLVDSVTVFLSLP